MSKTLLKVGGVVAIVAGSVALYLAGSTESTVVAIVGGVFVLAGMVIGAIKAST